VIRSEATAPGHAATALTVNREAGPARMARYLRRSGEASAVIATRRHSCDGCALHAVVALRAHRSEADRADREGERAAGSSVAYTSRSFATASARSPSASSNAR
jgi:hypothetical protein